MLRPGGTLMRRFGLWTGFAFILAAAAACGTGGQSSGDVDAATTDPDAPGSVSPDGGVPAGYVKLIGRNWSLAAGAKDTYKCVRIQVPQDMYISGFYAKAPTGTHHTVLTMGTKGSPLGDYDCQASNLDYQMLFASGVGTDTLEFPDGVAIKVAAGTYVNLNLHLFDATDHALSGPTEIYVKTLPTAPDAAHTAEMVFSGTWNIDIPSDNLPHTASGGCTLKLPQGQTDLNLIALWPHMHQTAIHQLVTLTPSGSSMPNTLLDKSYSFTEQKNYPWATPVVAHDGDRLMTTCTYMNNTGKPMTFGESSLNEMCFTGIYRYPAVSGSYLFQCVDDGAIPPVGF
jgi:hypothetical protein